LCLGQGYSELPKKLDGLMLRVDELKKRFPERVGRDTMGKTSEKRKAIESEDTNNYQ
jgi:hypothetical protein